MYTNLLLLLLLLIIIIIIVGMKIKTFSCCENNLLQLPSSIHLVDEEASVESDFNPFISPPQYLIAEGLKSVQLYMKIRQIRLDELHELLDEEDFEFNKDASFPTAAEVLEDGTGYLTPVDLGQFDQAVHEYLNAEYYKCPASGLELVERLAKLRELREYEIYLLILNTFQTILKEIWADKKKRKLYSDAVLMKEQRPWGIKDTMVNVWVVGLQCLIKDTPKVNRTAYCYLPKIPPSLSSFCLTD